MYLNSINGYEWERNKGESIYIVYTYIWVYVVSWETNFDKIKQKIGLIV